MAQNYKSYLDSWWGSTWEHWCICWLFNSLAGIFFFYHTHNINCKLQPGCLYQTNKDVTYYMAFVCPLVTSCNNYCLVSGAHRRRQYYTHHSNSMQSPLASAVECPLSFLCGITLEWIRSMALFLCTHCRTMFSLHGFGRQPGSIATTWNGCLQISQTEVQCLSFPGHAVH